MREIDYRLTKADYRDFYLRSSARRLWKFGLLVGVLLTGLNAWSDYCRCGDLSLNDLLREAEWGFGFAAAVCFAVLLLNAWSAAKIHDAMEPIAKEQTLSWDENGMRLASRFYSASYPWELFKRGFESKRVFAAYITSVSPVLFPKSAMSDGEIAELRGHLRPKAL